MDNTALDNAMAPGTFSVLDFVSEAAYPTSTVTIYTNVAAGKKYADLVAQRSKLEVDDLEEAEKLTPEIEQAKAALEESALTFSLRGYPGGIVQEYMNEFATDENTDSADSRIIAKAIVNVTSKKGTDSHFWSHTEVETLRGLITEGEYSKLLTAVADVVFNAAVFDRATDAGFLGGRPDMAE